jgi:hypothetical protein
MAVKFAEPLDFGDGRVHDTLTLVVGSTFPRPGRPAVQGAELADPPHVGGGPVNTRGKASAEAVQPQLRPLESAPRWPGYACSRSACALATRALNSRSVVAYSALP